MALRVKTTRLELQADLRSQPHGPCERERVPSERFNQQTAQKPPPAANVAALLLLLLVSERPSTACALLIFIGGSGRPGGAAWPGLRLPPFAPSRRALPPRAVTVLDAAAVFELIDAKYLEPSTLSLNYVLFN